MKSFALFLCFALFSLNIHASDDAKLYRIMEIFNGVSNMCRKEGKNSVSWNMVDATNGRGHISGGKFEKSQVSGANVKSFQDQLNGPSSQRIKVYEGAVSYGLVNCTSDSKTNAQLKRQFVNLKSGHFMGTNEETNETQSKNPNKEQTKEKQQH